MLEFKRKTKTIEIEGKTVHLREASEKELQEWSDRCRDKKGQLLRGKLKENRAQLIILCVVDENGNQVMDQTHLAEVMELPSSVVKRLHKEAAELCGLDDEESLEDTEKN